MGEYGRGGLWQGVKISERAAGIIVALLALALAIAIAAAIAMAK